MLRPFHLRRWAERGAIVEQGEDEEEHEGDADGGASHAVDGVRDPPKTGRRSIPTGLSSSATASVSASPPSPRNSGHVYANSSR